MPVFVPLTDISQNEGSHFIGANLEKTRHRLLQAFSNPATGMDYEDLTPFVEKALTNLNTLYSKIELAAHRLGIGPYDTNAYLRGYAQTLAAYLQWAIQERMRDDLCGRAHHTSLGHFSASGWNRVGCVGNFLISDTLHRLGIKDWRGFCTHGCAPTYKYLIMFDVANSHLRAPLSVHYHFGLSHEAGHALFDRRIVPDYSRRAEIKQIAGVIDDAADRNLCYKSFVEVFCDIFSLVYGFNNNLSRYLECWADHYITFLEYDNQQAVFGLIHNEPEHTTPAAGRSDGGTSPSGSARLRAVESDESAVVDVLPHFDRMMLVATYHFSCKTSMNDRIWFDAAVAVRDAIECFLAKRDERKVLLSRVYREMHDLAEDLVRDTKEVLASPDSEEARKIRNELKSSYEASLNRVRKWWEKDWLLKEPVVDETKGVAVIANALNRGEIVTVTEQDWLPFAVIERITDDFSANVAAVLSVQFEDELRKGAKKQLVTR